MDIEKRIQDLNIKLHALSNKGLPFSMGTVDGNRVILSGQTPVVNGSLKYVGTVGSTVSIEDAQDAAKICTINLLSALKEILGDLNKVKRIIKLNGYVASEKGFTEQPVVINAASNLLNAIFGEENKHARVAVGVSSLPGGSPVEVEMVVEFKNR